VDTGLINEFVTDWKLSGKAHRTVDGYQRHLMALLDECERPNLGVVKNWLLATSSVAVRRKRGQALRAFGIWCARSGVIGYEWIRNVPLATEEVNPQSTATAEDYQRARRVISKERDLLAVEILWTCGLRRSELARLKVEDIDYVGSNLIVRLAKNGRPRIVPIPPPLKVSLRRWLRGKRTGSLLGMSSNSIRLMLQRAELPSAHAWRRGWAVETLRRGVSEASLRAAAGWASGAMVARYTQALSQELAVAEFQRAWQMDT
jgi:integrase